MHASNLNCAVGLDAKLTVYSASGADSSMGSLLFDALAACSHSGMNQVGNLT